jgi:glycosyltransferase involved in cell wall biosynthesis
VRIVHLAAGLDEPSAGPSYSVRSLAQALRAQGEDVSLHSVLGWRGPPVDDDGVAVQRHRQDFPATPLLRNLCLSEALRRALRGEAARAGVIHAHGLWLMPDVYPAAICGELGVPFVLSPRGMLGPAAMTFSPAKKRLFWRLWQGPAARAAACLHATSEAEFAEIRAQGLINPVAVIANGVDLPQPKPEPMSDPPTVISLGRIHPKKGLVHLIEAWARIEARHPQWRLRIVGPDEVGHAAELAGQARALGLSRVSIEGGAFGPARLAALQAADIFVLPSLNENFALTVAEALAAGTPAIVSKGAPWRGLDEEGCGWWIDIGAEALAAALDRAMSLPRTDLVDMGRRGRAWMARRYAWAGVAEAMGAVYRWLAGEADRPAQVRLD